MGEEDPIGDWTEQYLYTFNLHMNRRVEQYTLLAKHYDLDGFVYHSNRSCKYLSQDIPEVRDAVTERTGLPGVIIEADHNDPRLYSVESMLSQLDNSWSSWLPARKPIDADAVSSLHFGLHTGVVGQISTSIPKSRQAECGR